MKRDLVKTLSYNKVDFRWISSHYDVHLEGSCIFNDSLHEFENDFPEGNEEMMVRIYKLDWFSRLKLYWDQWLFEKCIGYHWTYPLKNCFHYRKLKWFYKYLSAWYYKYLS